jgi:hypothetical protein
MKMKIKEPLGNGMAEYEKENGKLQMVGFLPGMPQRGMAQLKKLLLDFFKETEITEMDGFLGYTVKWPGDSVCCHYTMLTAYCAAAKGQYSVYEAIPNIKKGIDIEDEKPLAVKKKNAECRAAIRAFLDEIFKEGK